MKLPKLCCPSGEERLSRHSSESWSGTGASLRESLKVWMNWAMNFHGNSAEPKWRTSPSSTERYYFLSLTVLACIYSVLCREFSSSVLLNAPRRSRPVLPVLQGWIQRERCLTVHILRSWIIFSRRHPNHLNFNLSQSLEVSSKEGVGGMGGGGNTRIQWRKQNALLLGYKYFALRHYFHDILFFICYPHWGFPLLFCSTSPTLPYPVYLWVLP